MSLVRYKPQLRPFFEGVGGNSQNFTTSKMAAVCSCEAEVRLPNGKEGRQETQFNLPSKTTDLYPMYSKETRKVFKSY